MKDKVFSDSNVLLYLVREFPDKKDKALSILEKKPTISIQVINENVNVCNKKFKLPIELTRRHSSTLFKKCIVKLISKNTTELAIDILIRYKYSFYDSLIIASALENNCTILYTEDLHHNQVIKYDKDKLTIKNPFV